MPRLTLRERIFGRTEDRSLPAPDNELPLWAPFTGDSNINTTNALLVADVWSCVRLLSSTASSLPLHVFRKSESGRERVTSGRLVDLLDRPSPGSTQADLTSTILTHLLIHGAAYLAKYRRQGELDQLVPVHPDRIRPEIKGGILRFRYSPSTGPQQLLTERDVTYIKSISVDGLHGVSAVTQAARVLGLSDSLVKHAMAFFESSTALPSGVLRLPPDPNAPDADGRTRLQERLKAESEPHGVIVVEGEAAYEAVGGPMDDNQFVEQRRLATQEVCRVFGVPSHLLNAGTGGDSLTYSTSESMSADFVKYSLAPWLRRVELAVSNDRDLTSERQFVKYEVDALLRANARDRAEVYRLALDPIQGWATRAEIRALEDLPPEPDRPDVTAVQQMVARPPAAAIPSNGGSDE